MHLTNKIIILILIYFRKAVFSFEINNVFGDVISYSANKSYFGYTVQLIKSSVGNNFRVLVGSPLISNQNMDTGGLYSCSVNNEPNCKRYVLDLKSNNDFEILGRGLDHQHKRDGQWLGGALDVSDTGFVVCAPRWVNKIIDSRYYFVNGLCYWMPNNIDNTDKIATSLKPLLLNKKQGIQHKNMSFFFYAYGEAGMATHIVKKNEKIEILLGAPGVLHWKGTVIKYNNNSLNSPIVPNLSLENKIEYFSYFGYSVSSGFFLLNGLLMYVAGAPRGANLLGQIFVFNYNIINEIQIMYTANGTELGEYFGAAVTTTDFNGDGLDDIFVGSPTYSNKARDAGRVHFFQSNGKGDFKRFVLDEPNEAKARFGIVLSAIGDINMDGCGDVAIGAPYWGSNGEGAIFIYYGSKTNLFNYNFEKILASDINPLLRGFGISISKGLDIDYNGINDIAVGAYGSNQVVIIKQRPIITVIPSMRSSLKIVSLDSDTEDFNFTIYGCLNYTGQNVPKKIKFSVNMINDLNLKRLLPHEIVNTLTVYVNEEYCSNFKIVLKSRTDKEDRIYTEPLEFRFSYSIREDDVQSKNKTWSPIIVESKAITILHVPFETGCGNHTTCYPNLKIKAKWNNDLEKFVVGSSNRPEILFEMYNTGEPAFMSKLNIHVSIPLLSMPEMCEEMHTGFINCRIGNPLEKKKTLTLILDTSEIKINNINNITVNATITSIGVETDYSDNFFKLELPISVESNIAFNSLSEPEQYSFGNTDLNIEIVNETNLIEPEQNYTSELTVIHQIEVLNKGPSPLDDVRLDIFIPYKLRNEKQFLIIQDLKAMSNQLINCVILLPENDTEPLLINLHGDEQFLSVLPRNRTYNLACDTGYRSECIRVACQTSNDSVENMKKIIIKLELVVDLEMIDENRNFKDILVLTTSAFILSNQVIEKKYHHVSTVLIGTIKSGDILIWIITGVICGIIILVITIVILYKLRFFKRKTLSSDLKSQEMDNIIATEYEDEEENHL